MSGAVALITGAICKFSDLCYLMFRNLLFTARITLAPRAPRLTMDQNALELVIWIPEDDVASNPLA
jgi:hypothetical protein